MVGRLSDWVISVGVSVGILPATACSVTLWATTVSSTSFMTLPSSTTTPSPTTSPTSTSGGGGGGGGGKGLSAGVWGGIGAIAGIVAVVVAVWFGCVTCLKDWKPFKRGKRKQEQTS